MSNNKLKIFTAIDDLDVHMVNALKKVFALFKKEKFELCSKEGDESNCDVILQYIDTDIGKDKFIEQVLKHRKKDSNKEDSNKEKPIIFLGTHPLAGFHKADDKIKNFIDSSIWHRYVHISSNIGLLDLMKMIETVNGYIRAGLYTAEVALESLYIQKKIFEHINFVEGQHYHHGAHIDLQGFTSEIKCKEEAIKIEKKLCHRLRLTENCNKNKEDCEKSDCHVKFPFKSLKFLLIDDKANDTERQVKKEELICNLLHINDIKKSLKIKNNLKDAQEELKNNHYYDIVLLDYLLEEEKNDAQSNGKGKRYTATDLMNKIEKEINAHKDENHYNSGWLDKLWYFGVSAFPVAMLLELHKEDMRFFSRYHILNSGANPICQPEFFKYKLLEFINNQLDQIESPRVFLRDILKKLPSIDNDNVNTVHQWALKVYPEVIVYNANLDKLFYLRKQNTFLAQQLIKAENIERTKCLIEHLITLLYNIAYGTGMEWPILVEASRIIRQESKFLNIDAGTSVVVINKYINHLSNRFS